MATASEVLRIAAGEIGYSRWTDPQPGTKYGRWYAQSHGSYYGASGVPFCAMFVSWVMSRAGQAFPGLPAAYVPYVLSAGRSRAVSTRSAKPGDIVIFNWDGGVVDHIGFVEANHGSYIQTIEGNTNNGRVARRTRAWNTIAAILRPAYSGSATSSGGGTASSGGTGRLTVDGSCGPATIRRWQQVMGTSVDGIISGQYRPDEQDMGPTRARGLVRALRWRRNPTSSAPSNASSASPPTDSSAPPPSVPCRNTSASRRTRGSDPAPPEHSKAASTPADSKHKRPSTPMHGAEGRFCISASEAGLELVDRHLERVRHSSGRAERHEPRVAHAPDPLVDPLSGKSGGARDLRLPYPPFIQHIRERHPFRLPARYPSVPAHSASTPAGIECPDSPAANAPSAMTSEHNPSLSFMMSHAIGWEPGLPDSWDIRKALSSPPAPPPWRPARFGLPVEGNHHRGYGCYDRPEPGEKFARRLQQLRDLLHVHLLSLPTPPL